MKFLKILIPLMLITSPVMADDNVDSATEAVTLEKGDRAPFTGTLLSPSVAAQILANSDAELEKCRAESKYLLDKQLSAQTFQLNLRTAELTSCQYRLEANMELYEQNIDYLQKQAVTPSWEKPAWFVGGVLTGVAIFFGATYALDTIGD
jgi:hypothetical protein